MDATCDDAALLGGPGCIERMSTGVGVGAILGGVIAGVLGWVASEVVAA